MSTLIDLTNQKVGKLTPLRLGENTRDQKRQWVCECECGNEVTVRQARLRNGTTRSCGCLTVARLASKLIDITGKRFGRLTVVQRGKNTPGGQIGWVCKCDCGRLITTTACNLKRQTACVWCRNNNSPILIDLTGKRFGRLKVIKRDMSGRPNTIWLCRCDCGRRTTATSADLRDGRHKSCGCAGAGPQSLIDLKGKRFGKLTVLGRVEKKPAHRTRAFWKCKCDCGRLTVGWGTDLRRKRKISCGKCRSRSPVGRWVALNAKTIGATPTAPMKPAGSKRGRPRGHTDEWKDRVKKMLAAWDAKKFAGNKADAGRAFDFHKQDATKIINDHERRKGKK